MKWYLNGTFENSICYGGQNSEWLVLWMQFVGNWNKKKIYYMLVFSLAGGPVSWMSK